jgi:hypothetical protein
MVTDPVPRRAGARADYARSDALRALELPEAGALGLLAAAIEAGLADGDRAALRSACASFATAVAVAHGVAAPPVTVLGVRPHRTEDGRCTYEKFGDYDLHTAEIRLWTRTAMRHQVSAFGTFLATLCHETCHHLDVVRLGLADSPHTRGFYERAGLLYHHARGTPRKTLVWVGLRDGRYRIDWARTMRSTG